jgi:hypothetical protein
MKKTSAEWNKFYDYLVLDPDGWDRKNFRRSWYKEKITNEEFMDRAMKSTISKRLRKKIGV